LKAARKFAAFLIIFLLIYVWATPQNDTLFFRHYSVEQGLSHNNVTSIVQDSLGFMWYGTKSGLNKFDGYGFITFKHDPKNKNSLVSDDINCMTVEKSGIVWIGTKLKGVNRLDPYKGIFTAYQHKYNDSNSLSEDLITGIHADTVSGLIWIGTYSKGLNAFDPATETFRLYSSSDKNKSSLSNNSITCITESKNRKLWVGTNGGGINVFDMKSGTFTFFRHDHNNNNPISSDSIRDIYIDNKTGLVWAATTSGLSLINFLNGEIKIFRHADNDPHSLSSNDLSSVYQDKAGKIWVGTKSNGLNVYYPETQKFFLYSHETKEKNTLSSNNINSISQGRSGMFWAATTDGGLNAFNPKSLNFKIFNPFIHDAEINEDISSLYESGDGILWIGTNGKGCFSYNPSTQKLESIKRISTENIINNILAEKDQGIILSADNGLRQYDFQTGKVTGITSLETVTCSFKDNNNIVWMGTKEKGIFSFNIKNQKLNSYPQSNISGPVSCIMQDHNGIIWLGTYGDGVASLNPAKGIFVFYKNDTKDPHSIGSNYINSICEDSKGIVWLSTWGGGLNAYIRDKNNFTCYSTQDGLPTNSIGKILFDNNSNLWIGTDNGICRLTLDSLKIMQCRIFEIADGLPVLEFYNGISLKRKSGEMIFSFDKGLVIFNPDSLKNNPYKPPVIITDFQIFNKSVQPGDTTGILKSSISVTKEINLDYTQNVFSFEFTAMSFINAIKNKYAYKMEGFDKDWILTDAKRRFATYTNLSPGRYTFTVKASNNDGTWNNKGTSIKINIMPPYYQTWWFITLCSALFVLIIYGIYRYRMMQFLKMLRVRNKIASDLHDDIGSGLSSISVFSELIRQRTANKPEDIAPFLEKIDQTSRSMSEAIHDIVWTINPDNDKIEDVLKRMKTFAGELLDGKRIKLKFDFCEEIISCKLSMEHRKNFYLIFKEAINNIVKYAQAGTVNVSINSKKNIMEMIIADDGIGFDTNKSCDGNGLVNMKRRAAEMGGELIINSHAGRGTILHLGFKAA
jgi:ligand-binding sensor domain-containing protein/two-component sensor histidine kinase